MNSFTIKYQQKSAYRIIKYLRLTTQKYIPITIINMNAGSCFKK